MSPIFNGLELKMLRLFNEMSLEDVAARIDKSRQYLHKLETGQTYPTEELTNQLAQLFKVKSEIFFTLKPTIQEEQIHFRSQRTSRKMAKQIVIARADYMVRLVDYIETKLRLTPFNIPIYEDTQNYTGDDIERVAEECRKHWGLGLGPISNMSRFCEKLGIVITSFSSISKEVDALSLATKRPIIVRNDAKLSACRQRFDIGHELGHLILHDGTVTGDRLTEGQAHRFASAFLLPRTMLTTNFPVLFNGRRFNWKAMSEFKRTWKISKAAILYRARQLGLLTEEQYVSGVVYLKRTGEAISESEDSEIPLEQPELLANCIAALAKKKIFAEDISQHLNVSPEFIEELTGISVLRCSSVSNESVYKKLSVVS